MRADLLYAQASLDWAISNLPSFEERLNLWLHDNIKTQIVHTEPDTAANVIIAVEKSPFPLSFSVEVGALINAMRSALDILAWTIFKRDVLLSPDEVYFPIAKTEADWRNRTFKGRKFLAQLGGTERRIFESLKLYGGEGGNYALYCLHRLDIERKHRRLLDVIHIPRKLTIIGNFKQSEFIPLRNETGFIQAGNGETILGLWTKGAANPTLEYHPEVLVSDASLELASPIMSFLGECGRQTQTVINAFDY